MVVGLAVERVEHTVVSRDGGVECGGGDGWEQRGVVHRAVGGVVPRAVGLLSRSARPVHEL